MMTDDEWLYNAMERMNRRPTVDEEEQFIENVGKMMDNGHPEAYARREVFKRLFQKWVCLMQPSGLLNVNARNAGQHLKRTHELGWAAKYVARLWNEYSGMFQNGNNHSTVKF